MNPDRILSTEEIRTMLVFIGAAGVKELCEDVAKIVASHELLRAAVDAGSMTSTQLGVLRTTLLGTETKSIGFLNPEMVEVLRLAEEVRQERDVAEARIAAGVAAAVCRECEVSVIEGVGPVAYRCADCRRVVNALRGDPSFGDNE